ncbi:MAG TPA: hypothetical protein VLV87_05000 [Gammaproteobacteria bacterium]|nr:hypothetical protein [Gammaproteobacteria bacterium]
MRTAPLSTDASGAVLSGHAVSWAAIFAGAFVAAGVSLILALIGAGVGLGAATSWVHPGATVAKLGAATIIWLAIIQIIASWLGGYLAGRLRAAWPGLHTHEVYFRDTAHGLITWALATLAVATIFASTMSSIAGGTAKEAANAVGGAGQAALTASAAGAGNSQPGAGSQPSPFSYFGDQLLRSSANNGNGGKQSVPPPGSQPSSHEVARILADAAAQGGMTEQDRQYLAQIVAQRTGVSEAQAEQKVNSTFSAMQSRIQSAKDKAKQAADDARKASAAASLWFGITLLIGAFVASWSATFGGRRRDKY